MKCQLARFLPKKPLLKKYHNLLCWAAVEAPHEIHGRFLSSRASFTIPDGINMCLLSPHGRLMAISVTHIELLPYFADIEPYPYDAWFATGGERLPEEDRA